MPITRSAKKANAASLRKRVFNVRRKRAMKDAAHETEKLVAAGKNDDAVKSLPAAYKAIDKAVKTNVIKKNTAARMKSRLAKLTEKKAAK
jgi:small subunit ribosomal protein S20